jgi:hypothetical protein
MKAMASALLVTKAAATVQAAVPHKAIAAGTLRLFSGDTPRRTRMSAK